MKKGYEKKLTKRLFAILVAVVMTVTVVPAMGGKAAAETKPSVVGAKEVKTNGSTGVGVTYNVSAPNSNGIVTVTKKASQYNPRFQTLWVDGTKERDLGNSTSLSITIDMKKYAVGYHNITVYFYDGSGSTLYNDVHKKVPTYIYSAPANSLSQYEVYSRYLFYTFGNNYRSAAGTDYACNMYFNCKRAGSSEAGKTIYTNRAGFRDNASFKSGSLSPNTLYEGRAYYKKSFTYDGVEYTFTGPVSTQKFRSGLAKTPVKSFTLKAYKIKRKKYVKYYKYRYRYVGWGYYRVRAIPVYGHYYQYKLKAIVKMKKKPGAAGANICGKWVAGNKKKYTKALGTFTSTTKPKKRKMTVSFYTYLNRTYGGYSPIYKKKVKVK